MRLQNQKGQGLVEYLIILALMGAATIGIVTKLNQNVKAQFSNVIYSIQGGQSQKKAQRDQVDESDYKRTDFSNFMNGSRRGKSK